MFQLSSLHDKIFSVTDSTFEEVALEVFRYQYAQVEIYRLYCDSLKRNSSSVNSLAEIPFLPIEFFKSHSVIPKEKQAEKILLSYAANGFSGN